MARRCAEDAEGREELAIWWAIVWPNWASTACNLLMNCTDAAILGHYQGGGYLPAASTATVVMSLTTCVIGRGPCGTVGTLSANAYGAGQDELAGRRLQMGLAYTTLLGLLVSPAWAFAGECLGHLSHTAVSRADVDTYGRWRLIGLLPGAWCLVLQSWLSGRGDTKPALYTSVMAVLLNTLCNFLLIYGIFGWGGLGFIGSPLATGLTQWIKLAGLLWWSREHVSRCWPEKPGPSFAWLRCKDFIKLCLPLTISGLLEEFNMQLTAVFALAFGPQELATHNCMIMAFVFLSTAMIGFANGTSARVSHHVVRGHLAKIRKLCQIAGTAMFSWSFVVMVTFFALQEYLGKLFSDNPEVWVLSGQLSILVGVLYFLISGFYLALGVLEGLAKPTIIMVGFLFGCYVVGIPLTYIFGFVMEPKALAWWPHFRPEAASGEQPGGCGLLGLWMGLGAGYFITTVVTAGRLLCLRDWGPLVARARELAELSQRREALVQDSGEEPTQPL